VFPNEYFVNFVTNSIITECMCVVMSNIHIHYINRYDNLTSAANNLSSTLANVIIHTKANKQSITSYATHDYIR